MNDLIQATWQDVAIVAVFMFGGCFMLWCVVKARD